MLIAKAYKPWVPIARSSTLHCRAHNFESTDVGPPVYSKPTTVSKWRWSTAYVHCLFQRYTESLPHLVRPNFLYFSISAFPYPSSRSHLPGMSPLPKWVVAICLSSWQQRKLWSEELSGSREHGDQSRIFVSLVRSTRRIGSRPGWILFGLLYSDT